jgi:hypothetical protein
MARQRTAQPSATPTDKLAALVKRALELAKTARRNRMSLSGSNYYANKLVELRADATNIYRELAPLTLGDSTALGEMIERVFGVSMPAAARAEAARELTFSLRTTWRSANPAPREDDGLFPLSILSQSGRGYLVTVGRQMNGCRARAAVLPEPSLRRAHRVCVDRRAGRPYSHGQVARVVICEKQTGPRPPNKPLHLTAGYAARSLCGC